MRTVSPITADGTRTHYLKLAESGQGLADASYYVADIGIGHTWTGGEAEAYLEYILLYAVGVG